MAVRPIDANAMLNELKPLSFEAEHSAVLLSDVSKMMREWVERQPTLTPPNEPLTLDELRGMDGQPVWVKCLKPDKYTYPPVEWRILEMSFTGNFGVWNGDCALIERNYGTDWIAYRRPPEGEEDT